MRWLIFAGSIALAFASSHAARAFPVNAKMLDAAASASDLQLARAGRGGGGRGAVAARGGGGRGYVAARGAGGRGFVAVRGHNGRAAVAARGYGGRAAVAARGTGGRAVVAARGAGGRTVAAARNYRIGRRYYGGIWLGRTRHFWRGRWYAYGVGSCWELTPIGYVWICE
jgi:hypothetical protein